MTMTHQTKTTTLTLLLLLAAATGASASVPASNLDTTFLNADPYPLHAGDSGEVRFKISNTGSQAADNVTVRLQDSYPFTIMPDRQRVFRLGTVRRGEPYYLSTEVQVADDATDGSRDLVAVIETGDLSRTVQIPVSVESSDVSLQLASLSTTPTTLMPDTEDATMTVSVTNTGDAAAENAVLELDLPDAFEQTSSFSSREALGTVEAGTVTKASFSFDIAAAAGQGPVTVPASLTYTDGDGDSSERTVRNTSFQLYLDGRPQFAIVNVTESLRTGETGSIRITVRNTGSVESASTRLRVLDNSDLPFGFDSASAYIGSLEPGQTGTAVFSPSVESGAAVKQHLLDVELRGKKDTTVFLEQETVRLRVRDGGGGGLPVLPLVIGLAIALVGGAIAWKKGLVGQDQG